MKLKDNNLFLTSCRYQNFLYELENSTDYNYRVMVIEDVGRLIENTPCANNVYNNGFENNNYVLRSAAGLPNIGGYFYDADAPYAMGSYNPYPNSDYFVGN